MSNNLIDHLWWRVWKLQWLYWCGQSRHWDADGWWSRHSLTLWAQVPRAQRRWADLKIWISAGKHGRDCSLLALCYDYRGRWNPVGFSVWMPCIQLVLLRTSMQTPFIFFEGIELYSVENKCVCDLFLESVNGRCHWVRTEEKSDVSE